MTAAPQDVLAVAGQFVTEEGFDSVACAEQIRFAGRTISVPARPNATIGSVLSLCAAQGMAGAGELWLAGQWLPEAMMVRELPAGAHLEGVIIDHWQWGFCAGTLVLRNPQRSMLCLAELSTPTQLTFRSKTVNSRIVGNTSLAPLDKRGCPWDGRTQLRCGRPGDKVQLGPWVLDFQPNGVELRATDACYARFFYAHPGGKVKMADACLVEEVGGTRLVATCGLEGAAALDGMQVTPEQVAESGNRWARPGACSHRRGRRPCPRS